MIKLIQLLPRGHLGRTPKVGREWFPVSSSRDRCSSRQHKQGSRYLTAIRNGNFIKIKIPDKKTQFSGTSRSSQDSHSPKRRPMTRQTQTELPNLMVDTKPTSPRRLLEWTKSNLAVMTLNLGSVCILIGFTRSDLLELRTLTMVGQMTFATYNLAQTNVLWPSVIWSTLFASANAWKIMNIYQERTAEVHMTGEEEAIYVDFFMNHGVTPLQFSWIEGKAKKIYVKKGDALIHKGDVVDRIFLVVKGSTHAHIRGHRLTAASTSPATKGDQLEGGDSGAWIGELAFLDYFHRRHDDRLTDQVENSHRRRRRRLSLYTIIADDDCEVLVWTYEAMEELMQTSSDLRSAIVRAITAAVVAKFVNLTVGNIDRPRMSWVAWLTFWTSKDRTAIKEGSAMSKSQDAATGDSGTNSRQSCEPSRILNHP